MSGSQDTSLEALQADQALRASQPQPTAAPAQAVSTRPAPPPIMKDQPWQPAPGAQPEYMPDSTTPAAKTGGGVSLMDYGKQAWASWLGTVDGGLGLASYATRQLGASPDTVAHIEKMRTNTEQAIADTVSSMHPDAQRAAHASIFGGQDTDGTGEHIPTPGEVGWKRYIGMTAASFIPDALMAIVPGGIGAKLGMKLAGEVGAKVASTAATGAAFAAPQAGAAYEDFVKTIDQSKPADWQGNPMMDHLLEQGMSFEDAKKNIVGTAANHLVAWQAGIGAAMGAGGSGLLLKGPAASIGKSILGRIGLGATEGAALMGGGGGGGELAQQSALQGVGLQQDLDTSKIARAAASGAMGGAILGAAGGMLHGAPEEKAKPEAQPAVNVNNIDPTTQAALDNHLAPTQGALDLSQAPPGQNPGQQQGELFRSADQANTTVAPAAPPAAEQQLPNTQPGNAAPPGSQGAAGATQPTLPGTGPRPSDGMKVGELRDALKTMPGQDPKAIARMNRTDAAAAFDKAQTSQVKPEPASDINAQVAAVADPNNPKDAAFIAQGSPKPEQMPGNVIAAERPEGTLVTTDQGKANAFAAGDHTDDKMKDLLGYQETKASADASGSPTVVQGKDAAGNVVHEEVVSPKNVNAAMETAKAAVPEGHVTTTTPEDALARRETRDEEVKAQAPAEEAAQTPAPAPQAEAAPAPKPTKAEELKAKQAAKRAQAKAKMAETVKPAEKQGYVAPEVAADRSGAMAPADTRVEDQRSDMRAAVQQAVNKVKVVPIKAGTDLQPIMSRAIRDLYERIGKTDGSKDAAGEAIAKWGEDNKGRIPQTHSAYQDVAAMIHKEVTGKELIRPTDAEEVRRADAARSGSESAGMRDEAKTEATREGGNSEKAAPEEQSEGVSNYGSAEAKDVLPTQHADRLPWTLERVMQGTLDINDAEKMIGTQDGGRTRTHATLADYMQHIIKQAEDPKAVEGLVAKMQKIDQQKFPTPQAKKAAGDRLNAELKLSDPERIQAMKDKLAELRDPVHAIAQNEQKLLGRDTEGRPSNTNARSAEMRTPEVNAATDKLLAESEHRRVSLNEHLDAIANNEAVPAEMRALARKLSGMVHKDIQVMANEHTWGGAGTFMRTDMEKGHGFIEVNDKGKDSRVETVLHEAIHSVVSHYIDSLPEGHPDLMALKAIGAELREAALHADLSDTDINVIGYALSNPHELHTMLLTNPRLQKLAAEAKPSVGFRMSMLKLGYPIQAAKNMWAAFTSFVRRAVGLKGVVTPENASVLDYALRPTTDILERAHAYNYGTDAKSLVDQAQFAMPSFKDAKDGAIRAADFGSMGDKMRRWMLQGATTDGIVDWNKELLPPVEEYRRATEAVAARGVKFRNDYAERAADLATKLKGNDKVGQLMVDATIAETHLGPNANNAHLTTVGQQATAAKLDARYRALSPEDQKLYQDARDYYRDVKTEEHAGQLEGMLKSVMPGATDAQLNAVRAAVKTKADLDKFLADPANHSQFGSNGPFKSAQALATGIAKVHDQGFVKGDYFPLRRFGDYVVNYGDKLNPDDYGVEHFEKRGDADARRAELVKLDPTQRVSQVLDKRTSKLRDMLPRTTVVDEMVRAMEKDPALAPHADGAKDLLNSILMQHATRSQRAMNNMRRRGVLGASTDAAKVLAKDFLATSSRIGYLQHGVERTQAIQAMRDHADTLGGAREQIKAQAVIHELEQRMPSGDDASGILTGAARKFSSLGFVQSLMSPSHMITSSIEAHTNSTSILGARHGIGRTTYELSRALKDVSPILATGARKTGRAALAVLGAHGKALKAADWNLANVVRDHLIKNGMDAGQATRLFDEWNNAGLIDHSQVREMQRIAGGTDVTKGWWGKFMDLNAAGAHAVDVSNKTAIGLAAYRMELKKTGDEALARKYATDTIRKAMPNYNLANKARITTDKGVLGGFAGPLTQFKNYGIHMYSMMANLAKASIHGASPAERREARKAFAGILATHTMMAGVLTLLGDPLRWIGGAYDYATGAAAPHDYENDVRQWIADAFGPEMGEVISRGLPHLAGVDIHRRVGLANLLEPPEMKSFDAKGVGDVMMQAMTGAAGEDAATMIGGVHKMLAGDIMGGLKDVVPRIARDPMKAAALADKGVTDSKGKTIMSPDKISTADVARQAAGFQPSSVSEFREGRFAVQEAKTENSAHRTQLIQGWLKADPEDKADAKSDIDAWNRGHPGEKITVQQLLQQLQAQKKAAALPAGSFGLKLNKGQTRDLRGVGSFANTQ